MRAEHIHLFKLKCAKLTVYFANENEGVQPILHVLITQVQV